MIDEERTFAEFGYTSNELTYGSGKKVWAICDICGEERLIYFNQYRNLCASCAHSGKNHHMFGKHLSEETKKKLSKANIGKKLSEEHKQKIGKTSLGRKHSEKSKQKIRDNHKDNSGSKNSNWKGGISFIPYCSKFNNELKEYIRERDNNICQMCGKSKGNNNQKLTVHHIHYDKENCNPDLITLCKSCNSKVNFNRDYWEQYFIRLLLYNNVKIEIYNIENELNIWNYGNF